MKNLANTSVFSWICFSSAVMLPVLAVIVVVVVVVVVVGWADGADGCSLPNPTAFFLYLALPSFPCPVAALY